MILSVPQRPVVTTGLYLKQQVIPSARMDAFMQYYQAAGFSREVSKLGIVLEALSKPPYEPLREAFLKHLTLKTVFLLAMASGRRRSELQALVFDPQYIQFKPKGAGVTLYFTPEFMRKNQRPNQVNYPWYIPVVPTGRPEFGAPNCPLRAPKYYHRCLSTPN